MNRNQLAHAIRTACQVIAQPEVIIVGSQSILGSFDERDLPIEATMSRVNGLHSKSSMASVSTVLTSRRSFCPTGLLHDRVTLTVTQPEWLTWS